MAKCKLEYIWLDGYKPTQSLRSKTKIVDDFSGNVIDAPVWCFDGSSTEQAPGNSSDCLLAPVAVFPDPVRRNGFLVMCEVMSPDGTPHPTNGRAKIDDDDNDFWFGFEQVYTLWDIQTNEKMDKDRFRRDLGGVAEAYQEVARRLGIMPEAGPRDMKGPATIQ